MRRQLCRAALWLLPLAAAPFADRPAAADGIGPFFCPKTTFCRPEAPCIKWKCVCPKPVCNPCNLEHYGYYFTCWRPWFYPPDWSHCPYPPPPVALAESLHGGIPVGPAVPGGPAAPGEDIPGPRRTPEQLDMPR